MVLHCQKAAESNQGKDNGCEADEQIDNEGFNDEIKDTPGDVQPDDKSFNDGDNDDIEFCLPKNNFILHDIGNKMNHCVGTYDTLVRNKRATIIYLKKNNEYILCLEIRNKEIIQAKKKYNEILDVKEKEDKKVKDEGAVNKPLFTA